MGDYGRMPTSIIVLALRSVGLEECWSYGGVLVGDVALVLKGRKGHNYNALWRAARAITIMPFGGPQGP